MRVECLVVSVESGEWRVVSCGIARPLAAAKGEDEEVATG
jgi:hypothetical protein